MSRHRISIIGVSPEGIASLSTASLRLIRRAEIILGGERLLEMSPSLSAEKIAIKNNLAGVLKRVRSNLGRKRMVVLASGDPDFFGIARYLTDKLGKGRVEIIPNVSSMQLAFARIKENWDDACLVSAHSRPITDVIDAIHSSAKTGILTDEKNTPAEIARVLLEHGFADCRAYVCQDLGGKKERVISASLKRLPSMTFSPLSILVLIRKDVPSPTGQLLGLAEERFSQRRGRSLITKLEVRAVSLARLALNEKSIIWDIGAGSGAVSIEASHLAGRGQVFAIERDSGSVANIRKNIRKFDRHNVAVVEAAAPDGLDTLPAPTAVFIGGSGGSMKAIIDCACRRLLPGGRIVVNAATLENLQRAVERLQANSFAVETTMVNIARSQGIADLTRFEALNPVFVIAGKRAGEV